MRFFFVLRVLATVCLVMGGTLGLSAQSAERPSPVDNTCQNAVTTSAMRACENARYQQAQRDLDSAYQGLLQNLNDVQKTKLRIAQRAWIRFRDTNADFMASLAEGETLVPLTKIATLTEITKERAAELKKATLP